MNKVAGILSLLVLFALLSCGNKKEEGLKSDPKSEAMLSGIWINEDDESVAFKAVGDTLYYPDAAILPVHFRIFGDTIYLDGASSMKYFIEKFSPHVFQFRNQNGETVRLVKSTEADAENEFEETEQEAEFEEDIIQQLVKRDTVVTVGNSRYHCYVQVNPTTYKVLKTDYNNEGVGVSKVYYDNIINLAVYQGAGKLFSSDFHKQDFKKYVPEAVMKQSILSDIAYDHCDETGVVFRASLRIPEGASGYIVYITISPNGKCQFSQP